MHTGRFIGITVSDVVVHNVGSRGFEGGLIARGGRGGDVWMEEVRNAEVRA